MLQAKLRMSVMDLVDAVSSERPLLVAFDDVQWMDAVSLQLITMVIEKSATKPVALLFASRTPEQLPLSVTGRSGSLTVRVPGLGEPEMMRLLGALVERHRAPGNAELLARVVDVANGNPLYAHTLVEHWTNTGNTSDLPPTLELLIEQRLDELSDTGMHSLQVCTLLGRNATTTRINEILGLALFDLVRSLDHLHRVGLLHTVNEVVLVRHVLIAKRCLHRASPASLLILHAQIARSLEERARDGRDVRLAWDCAEHWQMAGEPARSRGVLRECGEALVKLGMPRGAIDIFNHLASTADNDLARYEALEGYHGALASAGLWQQVVRSRTEMLCDQLGSHLTSFELARQDIALLEALSHVSTHVEAVLTSARALAKDEGLPRVERARAALVWLAFSDNLSSEDETRSAYAAATELVDSRSDIVGSTLAKLIHDASVGELGGMADLAERIVILSRDSPSPAAQTRLLRAAALAMRIANECDRGLAILAEAIAICEANDLPHSAVSTLGLSIAIALEDERIERASIDGRNLEKWMRSVEKTDLVSKVDWVLLSARIEMISGTHGDGVKRIRDLDWRHLDLKTPRLHALFLATRVHLAHLEADDHSLKHFGEPVISILPAIWCTSCVDYVVGAAAFADRSINGPTSAARLASDYLKSFRRQRGPARGLLADFVSTNATELLAHAEPRIVAPHRSDQA